MTLLNNANDGLHPELIVLFRTVAYFKNIAYEDLLSLCLPKIMGENDDTVKIRLRGSLNNWIKLGLFEQKENLIQLNPSIEKEKYTADSLTIELPSIALSLVCKSSNCMPLWGDIGIQGSAADFIRGASWILAQDIYSIPSGWDEIYAITMRQSTNSTTIFQNNTRWPSTRYWMRYFGLLNGGDSAPFQVDPTHAVKNNLKNIFSGGKELSAENFLSSLSKYLPILDFGEFRKDVEANLNDRVWRRPGNNELSQSLSFALQRLDIMGVIRLQGKSDAKSSYWLTGKDYRQWRGFETVSLEV